MAGRSWSQRGTCFCQRSTSTISAGKQGIIEIHTSSIPMKPMTPNWLKPRKRVTVSEPYAMLATAEPTSSARNAFHTASRRARSVAMPRARNSL